MRGRYSRLLLVLTAAALAGVASSPAEAHHSFSMFDTSKTYSLDGAVREFQWTNPHIWVQLLVKDGRGDDVEWSIEGGSANTMARSGWSRRSLKRGDHAVIVIHPRKDGSNGGILVSASTNGGAIGHAP